MAVEATVLAVVGWSVFFLQTHSAAVSQVDESYPTLPMPSKKDDRQEFLAYWKQYLQTHSAIDTYVRFKQVYNTEENGTALHTAGHLIGGILYDAVGTKAFRICDQSFYYGCVHEAVGRIVSTEGVDIVRELNDQCDGVSGCQHGIGHGLVSYMGYTPDRLRAALSVCHDIGSVDPQDGCYGGIFMEYNMRTTLSVDGVPIRQAEPDDLAGQVCVDVPEYAKAACYFWLPQWFMVSRYSSLDNKVEFAAEECNTVSNMTLRSTCYKGLGYEIVSYEKNPSEIKRLCSQALPDTDTSAFMVECTSGAAASLASAGVSPQDSVKVCSDLNIVSEIQHCEYYGSHPQTQRIPNYKNSNLQ